MTMADVGNTEIRSPILEGDSEDAFRNATSSEKEPAQRRALFLAFLAANGATGITLGSFGVLMPHLQRQYDASSATISLGISFVLLMMNAMAPLTASIMKRLSIRYTMVLGATLLATGHAAIAFADHVAIYLLSYLCLIGPGVCFMGFIPASTLVSRWCARNQGTALGIVTMPFGVLVAPIAISQLPARFEVNDIYLLLAAAAAAIGLCLLAVREPPSEGAAGMDRPDGAGNPEPSFTPLAHLPFLVLCFGLGLLVFPGTVALVHLMTIAGDYGIPRDQGALLLSLLGGAGMVGALLFGLMADRIGPTPSLMLNLLLNAAAWLCLLLHPGFAILALAATIMGMCGGGILGTFSTLLTRRYGVQAFARSIGFASFLSLPFTFGAAPIAGYIRDMSGSYDGLIALNMFALALALPALIDWRRPKARETKA
jgi:MFS family permease